MHKTTVYLPDDLRRELTRLSRETHRSEADLIREAIASLVRTEAAPEPRVPLFRASGEPLGDAIDDALDGFGT